MKSKVLCFLMALPAFSAPITSYGTHYPPIPILSGSASVTSKIHTRDLFVNLNLLTGTGSLTGFAAAWFNPVEIATSFDPSIRWGWGNASMTIVHNGVSYRFEPRQMENTPSILWPAVFQSPSITFTLNGPRTYIVPFTVTMLLEQNTQFNGATAQFFEYYGSGTATMTFTSFLDHVYLANAELTFTSIPEPGAGALCFVAVLGFTWNRYRLRKTQP